MNNNFETRTDVRWTTNYPMFKKLPGNRDIDRKNVERLKASIQKFGMLPEPILVNERYEVIDGQHRLQALRELGLPVPYIVVPGAGSETAVTLNLGQKNWNIADYIHKYSAEGNPDYVFLSRLIDKYGYALTATDIFKFACSGTGNTSYDTMTKVREGRMHFEISDRHRIEVKTEWLARMAVLFKGIKGFKRTWTYALMFCYDNQEIDTQRLTKKLEELSYKLKPATDVKSAIDQIETVYNYRCPDDKLYISHLYQKSKDGGTK